MNYPGKGLSSKAKVKAELNDGHVPAAASNGIKLELVADNEDLMAKYHHHQLFPQRQQNPCPPTFFMFSKNCTNFNRLFHASFDDEESSSSSTNQDQGPQNCDTKVKVEPASEILLEIEIETATDVADQPEEEPEEFKSIINLFGIKQDAIGANAMDTTSTANGHRDLMKTLEDEKSSQMSKTPSLTKKGRRIGERKSKRLPQQSTSCKTQEAQIMRRITIILKKETMTEEDKSLLDAFPTLVRIVRKRFEARLLSTQRLKEFEDSTAELELKCNQLAEIISRAKYLVVYSGAGISTAANIPDFRGATGLWTLLKNGQGLESQNLDTQILMSADPTTTHMALKQLYSDGIVKHIVSQNCDGLHLRSGIPKMGLSEIHGNMFIEVCGKCGRDYARTFDVAENTRRHEHRTGRRCYNCHSTLRDTIVHFGERGKLRWPINWAGAEYNAHRADVILCIGSSLKVLRRYPWLWCMDKPASKRPKLVIVNLMWTPKDTFASLKIHGRCDDVMARVMERLNIPIPSYSRVTDPLFRIATPLHLTEIRTRTKSGIEFPENEPFPLKLVDMNNYIQFEPIFRLKSTTNTSEEEEEDVSEAEVTLDSRDRERCVKTRSTTKKFKKVVTKRTKNRVIKRGTGNGWLGNLTPGVKMKKRKVK